MARKKKEPPVITTAARKRFSNPSRRAYVMAEVSDEQQQRLKRLALDERTTVAEMVRDGLNLLLKSKKLPPL
jgi:hypothetical protein